MPDQPRRPDDVLTARDADELVAEIDAHFERIAEIHRTMYPQIVTVEEDRSAIAYLRGHILGLLYDRQNGLCFFCDQEMPYDCGGMHIHHEPPLSVRMPNGYGRPTPTDQLHLTHPKCNLSHKKPRRRRSARGEGDA